MSGVAVFEVQSPLGALRGAATDEGLALLAFPGAPWDTDIERLESIRGTRRNVARHAAASELRSYFAGGLREFRVPVDLALATPFAQIVLRRLTGIPFGEVTTYGALARDVERPGGARAVGQAVGSNPVPIVVPCHRVIASGGGLGGFGLGLDAKRWLLRHEGRGEA